jgi:hypothetical protein
LKKVCDINFSRAQKGFTNERYIQEVLINVIESIAHCKQNKIPACILSIDQAKAFDSVSHKYKNEVYKFFGFGPKFVNMLNTLCTNRKSCITFDDGTLSSNFDLERGDTQGNTPSPVLYNLAQQIFLFKLELCPEIKSVFVNHLIPRPIAAPILVNVNNGVAGDNMADIINSIMTAVSDEEDIPFLGTNRKRKPTKRRALRMIPLA